MADTKNATCRGCRKPTTDFMTSFLADNRRIVLCRERKCAHAWLQGTGR
ncbi:hypothetical protein [Plantactinospora sp. WMMB782]